LSKFELSLAKDYVSDWTYTDAIRELFQNALDQEVSTDNNKMFFDYNPDSQVLSIGNKSSVLDTSTLLLGSSTKRDNADTIGQFGEGYKIATLVLTREGKSVTFYNYGNKEVWKPRFVKSRRYKTEILTFFVDKKHYWQNIPDNNLTIEVSNVSQEEYKNIIESNLHLQEIGDSFTTNKGRILLEKRYKSKVYVNGLYVCNYKDYHYGYDFKPSMLKIDRDRKLVNNFELRWLASKMWLDGGEEKMRKVAANLIRMNAADVDFVSSYTEKDEYSKTADYVYEDFMDEHGNNAIPVTDQEGMESASKSRFNPILVSSEVKTAILSSHLYKKPKTLYKPSLEERLKEWLQNHKQSLSNKAIREIKGIIGGL